jgi:hypothetical protein
VRSALIAVLLIASAPALANAGEEVVIVVGKSQTLVVPFPLGEGSNSNPKAVRAAVDPPRRRITFFGVGIGAATYTVTDARRRSHSVTYEIRVVGVDLGQEQACLQQQWDDIESGIMPNGTTRPCDEPGTGPSLCEADADATTEARDSCSRLADQLKGVEGIRIHASGNDVVVEGEVADPDDMDRVNAAVAAEHAR